LFIVYVVLII